MDIWEHDGQLFQYDASYHVDEDAWHHELTGLSAPGFVLVSVPDATPDDAAFTPSSPDQVLVRFTDGSIPWPIWLKFISTIQNAKDLPM